MITYHSNKTRVTSPLLSGHFFDFRALFPALAPPLTLSPARKEVRKRKLNHQEGNRERGGRGQGEGRKGTEGGEEAAEILEWFTRNS